MKKVTLEAVVVVTEPKETLAQRALRGLLDPPDLLVSLATMEQVQRLDYKESKA